MKKLPVATPVPSTVLRHYMALHSNLIHKHYILLTRLAKTTFPKKKHNTLLSAVDVEPLLRGLRALKIHSAFGLASGRGTTRARWHKSSESASPAPGRDHWRRLLDALGYHKNDNEMNGKLAHVRSPDRTPV